MTVLFQKIDELSDESKVAFYTVTLDENDLSEFELFVEKDFPNHEKEIETLYNAIDLMKDKGALKHLFKDEESANALPRVPESLQASNRSDYGIRLYCVRLTNEIVVLLNGDIKTRLKNQDCPNVKKHFVVATKIARAIDKLIVDREISLDISGCLNEIEIEI